MTAVIERSSWKYRHSHAYRVLYLDAGHLGQTFQLVCTYLGLGPCTFAATHNRLIERELGLDGVSEIVIYTAAVGVPTPIRDAGLVQDNILY
jgi:SagB-type dehydrogenase family enzyme